MTTPPVRELPRELESERAILAAVLVKPERWPEVASILEPADFSDDLHLGVFGSMRRVVEEAGTVDIVLLNRDLERRHVFNGTYGPAHVTALLEANTPGIDLAYHAGRIKAAARLRAVGKTAERLLDAVGREDTESVERAIRDLQDDAELPDGGAVYAPREITLASAFEDRGPLPVLIENYIMRGDRVLVGGESSSGKSITAADLALACAGAGPFLDRFKIQGDPMRVLYLDEENPERLVLERFRKLARARGLSAEALADLPIRYLSGNTFRIDEDRSRRRLLSIVDSWRPGLVILDSLVRFHTRDENSAREVAQLFAEGVDPLVREYGCTVVVLHHLNKGDGGGNISNRVRGSGDFKGVVDQLLVLDVDAMKNRTLHHAKCRWQPEQRPLGIVFRDLGDGLAVEAEDAGSTTENLILAHLTDAAVDGLLRQDLATLCEAESDAEQKTFTRALGRLKAAHRVKTGREGKQARYWMAPYAPPEAA